MHASPHHSVIVVIDGEIGQDIAETDESREACAEKVTKWLAKTAAPTTGEQLPITISRDQTSGSQFLQEILDVLKKAADPPNPDSGATVRDSRAHRGAMPKPENVHYASEKSDSREPSPEPIIGDDRYNPDRGGMWKKTRTPRAMNKTPPSHARIKRNGDGRSRRSIREVIVECISDEARTESSVEYDVEEPSSVDELRRRLKTLERENDELRHGVQEESSEPAPPPVPHYTWRTFHCINDDIYLEQPQWKKGGKGPILLAEDPLQNVNYYLESHPEIAFVYYKDYVMRPPSDLSKIISKDGIFRPAEPWRETLSLVSEYVISAVETLEDKVPGFSVLFPNFDAGVEIPAPYLFLYYSLPLLEDVRPHLDPLESDLLNQLIESILASHGREYVDSKRRAKAGLVSKKLIKYLVKPGDVLIQTKGHTPSAFIATSWAKESQDVRVIAPDPEERRTHKVDKSAAQAPRKKQYSWDINAWSWRFDGVFARSRVRLAVHLEVGDEDEEVAIDSLGYYPLQYGTEEVRDVLEKRGRTLWKCRYKNYVSHQEEDRGVLNSIGERYMVDVETYKRLHPESAISRLDLNSDLPPDIMANDEPPAGDEMLVAPSTLIGFNLRTKRWMDLEVDRVSDVAWNKEAFENLVVNEQTKELVQALVTNQLAAEKSTDLIIGKGNGLTILLHGGPGTGKTFTAEGVAEIAEKPLYRVTCGDIGTEPEAVEKYLESVLNLGKVWDCVVLLDEADVFLEERGLADLQRNALVSVFLRVLEYNVGILILTSNRVGTFDEAFKSRIQLALHYKSLDNVQQKQIWRNFIMRLKSLDEDNIDFHGVMDRVEDLAKEDMNGRQIRNAITTARQLAQYKKKKFCYEHLKHVIEVSGEFEKYLKRLRNDLSDDQIKRDEGTR